MKRFISVLLSAAFMLCLGAASMAQTRRVDVRERCEQRRIHQGVRSGELTRQEAARLRAEQFRIRAYEARARSDGSLDRRERYRLDHMLDRAGRDIYRQKHDGQDRDR